MKLKYKKQYNKKIKHQFLGAAVFELYDKSGIWLYNTTKKRWQFLTDKLEKGHGYCNFVPCKSIRAFRRILKKFPKGIKFILISKWAGYDVYGIGNNPRMLSNN